MINVSLVANSDAYLLQQVHVATQSKEVIHCKNLRVVLTLLWVISVACSGASIPSAVSAAIWTFSLATEFPVIYQNG